MYDVGEQVIFTIILIYLSVFGFVFITGLVSYIFRGIGMYALGKRRGMENPWLAFVPFARTYFQGKLCGTLTFEKRQIKEPGIWMLLIPIVNNIVTSGMLFALWMAFALRMLRMMPMISYYEADMGGMFADLGVGNIAFLLGTVVVLFISIFGSAVQNVLIVLVNNQIFARHTDRNYALVHAVLGIFIPLYTSIYFFIIRNWE